jgi:hypothetical protein
MKNQNYISLQTGILLFLITNLLSFSSLLAEDNIDLFLTEKTNITQQDIKENKILTTILTEFSQIQQEKLASKSEKKAHYLLFKAIQKRFLKEYKNYQSLRNTIQDGSFDCLTGTAVYALILKELKYDFEIWEMQHHIFLMIKLESGEQILVESTDPVHGFVLGQKNINRRIASYQEETIDKQDFYSSRQNFEGKISLQNLAGLQHYNLAVVDFNSQKFEVSTKKLEKSLTLYESKRAKELLMLTIAYLPSQKQNELWTKYDFANFAIATK